MKRNITPPHANDVFSFEIKEKSLTARRLIPSFLSVFRNYSSNHINTIIVFLCALPFLSSCTPIEYQRPAATTQATFQVSHSAASPKSTPNSLSLAPATTLHAVLVGDTNDPKIGASVKVDLENLRSLVQSIAQNTNLSVPPINSLQVGKSGDYDRVIQKIESLSVGDQDVVFFYYSGHGGRQPLKESPWPALFVEGPANSKMLSLDDVIATLQRKSPRLLIVITDSCNTLVGQKPQATKEPEEPNNYKKLFLGYQGTIIASSSIPKEPSYGDPKNGGAYTRAFLDSFKKQIATSTPEPSWENLMQDATQPITVEVETIPNNRFSRREIVQQPQSEVKVNAMTSVQPRGPEPSPKGHCSQNEYSPHPTDPNQECCLDDDNSPICAEK